MVSLFTPFTVGTVLENRYQLIEDRDSNRSYDRHLLGSGGFGAVYLAHDLSLNCEVAIKQSILLNEKNSLTMFRREAQFLANLSHPGLPKVSRLFSDEESCFIVMDLIRGDDLEERVRRSGSLPFAEVRDIALQLFEVLDYLHTHSIIHKDIKPANLKYTSGGQLKLLDFGFAKGSVGLMSEHKETIVKGLTPAWAPPEQMEFEPSTPQSDLYSASATLYFLASGVPPPDANIRAMEVAIEGSDVLSSLDKENAQVPEWFAEVINEGLSLSMEKRPPSAAAMRERLENELLPIAAILETHTEIKVELQPGGAPTEVSMGPIAPARTDLAGMKGKISYLRRALPKQRVLNTIILFLVLFAIIIVLSETGVIDPERHYRKRGNECFSRKDYACAVENYSKVIELKPDNPEAYFWRGAAYSGQSEYELALKDYGKAIDLKPQYSDAHYYRGGVYLEKNDCDQAVKEFASMTIDIANKELNYFDYYLIGCCYFRTRQYAKALIELNKAIELNREYAFPYFFRGRIHLEQAKYADAIADYSEYVKGEPNDGGAYFSRALAYYYTKQYAESVADYTEYIKGEPNDRGAYYNRALAYYGAKLYDEAIDDCTEAIGIDPNASDYYDLRANSYQMKDDRARALADRKKANELKRNGGPTVLNKSHR